MLLGLINVVMILILYFQENRVKLSDKEKAIYEHQFSGLSLLEFDKLLKVGEWEVYEPGTRLIEDGIDCVLADDFFQRKQVEPAHLVGTAIARFLYVVGNAVTHCPDLPHRWPGWLRWSIIPLLQSFVNCLSGPPLPHLSLADLEKGAQICYNWRRHYSICDHTVPLSMEVNVS